MNANIDDLVIVSEEIGYVNFYDADGNETRVNVGSKRKAHEVVRAIYANLRTYENVERWIG